MEPWASRCPHCGARGVRCEDRRWMDGLEFSWPYCGKCGRNYPTKSTDPTPGNFTAARQASQAEKDHR